MYSRTLFVLLFVFCLSDFSIGQWSNIFFRKDYDYSNGTKSFYKIHTIPKTWAAAKLKCAQEGASLFYPEDEAEANEVIKYWKSKQPTFDKVFVGVTDLIAKGVYETIDGRPYIDVFHNWAPGQPDGNTEDCVVFNKDTTFHDYPCSAKFQHICKKTRASLEWNYECNIPNPDYSYSEEMGRCYKLHVKPLNWTQAYAVCNSEQSYLAIINSPSEADLLVGMLPQDINVPILLGFHNITGEGWQTVRGSTLKDSGYTNWADGQPDGFLRGVEERCGAMLKDGLTDIQCERQGVFICEYDVNTDSSF